MASDSAPSSSETPTSDAPDWVDAGQSRRGPSEEIDLRMSVVEYAHRPDRCTVYEPDLSPIARMSTWVSVDVSLVESLASRR